MLSFKVSPGCKHYMSAVALRYKVWVMVLLHTLLKKKKHPVSSLPLPPLPQDLLVNYTWALLFNMGWKHTWVPSIKHFLCCTLFLWYTVMSRAEVCMCVWHSETGRNYSLTLYFALSASLLIFMFNNSGANAELQISSRKNRINWPSSQASCQSLGWCVDTSPRTPNSIAQYGTERKKQRSRAERSIENWNYPLPVN